MPNFRLLLIRLKIHRFLSPLSNFFLKSGNFIRLSEWISKNTQLAYNDFYSKKSTYYDRYKLYQHIVENEIKNEPINYLEFGVGDAETLKWWIKTLPNPDNSFYGFDTFQGIPEAWGVYKKGSFNQHGKIPVISDSRVKLYEGLFQDTLHGFLPELQATKKNVLMLDADLYSSTLFAMASLSPYLKKGDLLIFDEFLAPMHEFLAYQNFCESFTHLKLETYGAANNYMFVAFKVA